MTSDSSSDAFGLFDLHLRAEELQYRFGQEGSLISASQLAVELHGLQERARECNAPEDFVQELIAECTEAWAKSAIRHLVEGLPPEAAHLGIHAIADLGLAATNWLKAPERADLCAEAARFRKWWPVTTHPDGILDGAPSSLGEKTPAKRSSRKTPYWGKDAPLNMYVEVALWKMEQVRKRFPLPLLELLEKLGTIKVPSLKLRIAALPPLSTKTAREWGSLAFEYVDEIKGGKIEDVPKLREIGEYRRDHSLNSSGEIIAKVANIRDGICERFCGTFARIARSMSK